MATNFQSIYFMNIAVPYVRNQKKPSPKDLYNLFHKKIQEKQVNDFKHLKLMTDLIEKNVRLLNIVTDDPIKQQHIQKTTELLMKMDKDIREIYLAKDSEFLTSLNTVFNYRPDVR